MNLTLVAIAGIMAMLILVLFGMNIGIAMFITGFVGYWVAAGSFDQALFRLEQGPFTTASTYSYSVIPLFVVMGEFALQSGMGKGLYDACERWLGRFPGGLALASIVSNAGFGAICGSSSAAVATMGRLSLPEMRRYSYKDGFSAATAAAGGTLSWLIPPSTGFILYGIIASVSIGRLFAAGVVPGLILMAAYMIACAITCHLHPETAPRGDKYPLSVRMKSLVGLIPVVILFGVVIGGMFIGWFSATEAAAIGAFFSIFYALIRGKLTLRSFLDRMYSSLKSSLMVFQIMMGASIFGYFLTVTGLPQTLAAYIAGLEVHRLVVIGLMFVLYIIIGMFMDTLSAVLITIPIFYPIVTTLGFDPVWFGVIIVLTMVLGTITPPIGINLFIAAGIDKNLSLADIYRASVPFCIALVIVTILCMLVPQISLWLPNMIYGIGIG